MKSKLWLLVLGGILVIVLGLFSFGAINPFSSATSKLKDCGPVGLTQLAYDDFICPDGSPNSGAKNIFEKESPNVMQLKSNSTSSQIDTAICADFRGGTYTEVIRNAYEFKYAEYGWKGIIKSVEELESLGWLDSFCDEVEQSKFRSDSSKLSIEDRYDICVSTKKDLRGSYSRIIESLMNDDYELGVWFTFYNQIKDELRGRVSQKSKDLIDKRKVLFDNYQILQCELNFPVLKDPEPESNSVPEEPWTPSGVV
jgi:hypothetical protein